MSYLLVGDIGGTNARFQFYSINGKDLSPSTKLTLQPFLYPNFSSLLSELLKQSQISPSHIPNCVMAVCGPVWNDGRSNHCNNVIYRDNGELWKIHHANEIESEVGLSVNSLFFLNDFEANGYAIASLLDPSAPTSCRPKEPSLLHKAPVLPKTPVACVGAGTGLGACFLSPFGTNKYSVFPSEAGMTDSFSPRSDEEYELLKFLRAKYVNDSGDKHLDIEAILSGPGLFNLYEFFQQKEKTDKTKSPIKEILEATPENAPMLISQYAQEGDALCLKVVDLWLDVYGRVLGSAALTWMCYGGLYIAGGILPKLNWRWSKSSNLINSYLEQGPKMTQVVSQVPLYLLDDADCGILGCLYVAWSKIA